MSLRSALKRVLPLPAQSMRSEFRQAERSVGVARERIEQSIDKLMEIDTAVLTVQSMIEREGEAIEDVRSSLLSDLAATHLEVRDQVGESTGVLIEQIADSRSKIASDVSAVRDDVASASNAICGIEERLSSKLWNIGKGVSLAAAGVLRRTIVEHLDLHVVDHCNLNCAHCSTFSPIADRRFVGVESFKSGLARMYNLVGNKVVRLHILGGEPLLHPDIEMLVETAREIFPDSRIDVTTNGVLVPRMPSSFWSTMSRCDAELKFTRYPVGVDYEELERLSRKKGVFAYSASDNTIEYFRRIPLNPKGSSSVYTTYLQCPYISCPQLVEGTLYRCPASAYACILNKRLVEEGESIRFRVSTLDSLNLEAVNDEEEVLDFLSRPIAFCQYCDMTHMSERVPWGRSTSAVDEWVDL